MYSSLKRIISKETIRLSYEYERESERAECVCDGQKKIAFAQKSDNSNENSLNIFI